MRKITNILFMLFFVAATCAQEMPHGRRGILPPDWTTRRTGKAQKLEPGGDYYTGEKHQLVVLAEFADQPFVDGQQAAVTQWNAILNDGQQLSAPFIGSLHDYFDAQSYGVFNLVCDIQYVRVGNRERYKSTAQDDENSQYLVLDIVDSLARRTIDWSLYDWNGDGYINQLLIIFAGQGSKYGGFGDSYDAIWPHQWWLSAHRVDRQSGIYYEPRIVSCQGRNYLIDSYCAVQELWKDNTYAIFGTLVHEYTHCFGFPDFYSYYIATTPYQWELMDNGCYNGDGFCPASYSAHERWIMGWMTPVELNRQTTITGMPALEDEPVAYLIRNDGYESEYYIVENRQQKGWDAALPASGVLVFHIDYDPALWVSTAESVNMANAQHYMLIKANNKENKSYCSGWAFPYGDNNSLMDTSVPAAALWHANTDGSQLMHKPVTAMTVTNGLASFEFMPSDVEANPAVQSGKQLGTKILRDGQICIIRNNKTYNILGMEY